MPLVQQARPDQGRQRIEGGAFAGIGRPQRPPEPPRPQIKALACRAGQRLDPGQGADQIAQALAAQAATIRADRSTLADALRATPGAEVFASDANFVLFRIPKAAALFDALVARGVLIKNVTRAHPLLADCLRVTVGTPAENQRFIAALHDALAVLG